MRLVMLGSRTENPLRETLSRAKTRIAVEAVLAVFAVSLCWVNVSWALRPGLFPILDEVSTRGIFLLGSYGQIVHFFPNTFYADRPLGWAFIRLVADWFDFDYARQAACLLVIHFANCGLAFWLFRRLGVGIPVAIAGVGLFGSLWTTAQTATYLGEAFDAICLFFLLGSALAVLSERRGSTIVSAVLFLGALRSKEFAIVTPFVLTVLVGLRLPGMRFGQALAAVARRLWLHYLILTVFGLRYLYLFQRFRTEVTADNPYRMDLHAATVLKSLSYYTALIFGADDRGWELPPALLGAVLALILCWAILRRRAGVAFGLITYVLTALPVLLMPYIRAAYWVYAPQLFLILAMCLLAEEVLAQLGEHRRWVAAVCLAVACLSWCVAFRRSPYFHNRVRWTLMVRRISTRTAREANAQFPPLGPGTHVYVNHGRDTPPWLFVPGPCSYLQLVNGQRSITCVLNKPADQLRELYEKDRGPKYFVDYHEDGSIRVGLPMLP